MSSNLVWHYINPVTDQGPMDQGEVSPGNPTFRVDRYPPGYSAFAGRVLTPNGTVELDSSAVFAFRQAGRRRR